MPKKRTRDDMEYYKRKIRELEEKERRKRRRIIIQSSDSDGTVSTPPPTPPPPASPQSLMPTAEPSPPDEISVEPTVEVSTPNQEEAINVADPELDPELLTALVGDETECTPKFGEKIHRSLAQRWEPILKKGLLKEAKHKLLKEYLVPKNCTLLQAPNLNNEVSATISDAARLRDKRKETDQQQLGVDISAISKALTIMLTGDNKLEAIRILSDGCRILTELHHQQTQARINVINYSLAKPFLNIVQDIERDETLYGNKLAEKIKASKTIEKQGLSIKKFVKTAKTSSTEQTSTAPPRSQYHYRQTSTYQGNWTGPPRFQQNRGGGEECRAEPTTPGAVANQRSPRRVRQLTSKTKAPATATRP